VHIFESNSQILRPNVRKRLKTFENIRKLLKNDVKLSKNGVKRLKRFENIRKILTLIAQQGSTTDFTDFVW